MCQFFSFCTKGSQKFYFDWKQRHELLKNNPKDYNPDSHSSICHFFGIDEDKVNKYEYYPITKEFKADQINIKDDRALAEKWVKKLDFKTIVEPLIIKEIVNPLKLKAPEFNDEHKLSLKKWASVGASVGDSVWASVWDSVWASVGASVRDSVGASVGSFFSLPRESWKYTEKIETNEYPFQSAVTLLKMGLVPSFDGKLWRLHSKNGIVWEGKI
jgi:hypothetical protein